MRSEFESDLGLPNSQGQMYQAMNFYISFVSVGSIIIAAMACPYVSQMITRVVSKILGHEKHFLVSPPGDGFLKIAVFVFLWIAVSFLLDIPLFLKAPFATS